jgi:hypothetical protein
LLSTTDLVSDGLARSWPSDLALADVGSSFDEVLDFDRDAPELEAAFFEVPELDELDDVVFDPRFRPEREFDFLVGTDLLLVRSALVATGPTPV